jgi:hypothetical protein
MHDDLDNLIDSALSAYSRAEPLAGLETRVLQRVRTQQMSRRRLWRWAPAVPVLAAILIAVLVYKPRPVTVAKVAVPAVIVEPPRPSPAAVAGHVAPPVAKTRRPSLPGEPPKRKLFPTPSPLTTEERLLVELAESHPQELAARPAEEIDIKPIQIAPLQIGGQ